MLYFIMDVVDCPVVIYRWIFCVHLYFSKTTVAVFTQVIRTSYMYDILSCNSYEHIVVYI